MIGLVALLALGAFGIYEYEKTSGQKQASNNPWNYMRSGEGGALVKGQDAAVKLQNKDSGKLVTLGVTVTGIPSDTPSKKYTLLVQSFYPGDVAPAAYGVGTMFETTRDYVFDVTKGPPR